MTRARWWFLAAPIFMAALTACGWSSPSSTPSPGHWAADPFAAEAPWRSPNWYGEILEPSAENASLETRALQRGPHHIAYVRRDGAVEVWRYLHEGGYAVHDAGWDSYERLVSLCTEPGDDPSSYPLAPIVLAADRQVPWRHVRHGMLTVAALPVPTKTVRICAASWPSARTHYLGMVVRQCPDPAGTGAGALTVRLSVAGDTQAVALDIDDNSWTFPPAPEEFANAEFLAEANETWKDVKKHLAGAVGELGRAQIHIQSAEGDLWFAYVVSVLDHLLGAGIREVVLVEDGICLSMQAPTGDMWPVDDPAVGWWMLKGTVVAVALALLVTFLPLWRWRRRTRRTA